MIDRKLLYTEHAKSKIVGTTREEESLNDRFTKKLNIAPCYLKHDNTRQSDVTEEEVHVLWVRICGSCFALTLENQWKEDVEICAYSKSAYSNSPILVIIFAKPKAEKMAEEGKDERKSWPLPPVREKMIPLW